MKKIRVILLCLLTVVFLSGCWDRVEINDLAVVTATGLDLTNDDRFLLSLQIVIPTKISTSQSGGASSGKGTFIISDKGETVSEAYRNVQKKVARRIFFSQSRVLVIGEDLAKKGVSHILDFHSRYHEPRINSYIMFTKGKAADIIKSKPRFENVTAEETKELAKLGVGLTVLIRDFENMIYNEGQEPVAPRFELENMEENTGDSDKSQTKLGAAIFKGDKLIGWMNDKETRGIMWITNKMKEGIITFVVEVPEEHGGGKISADLYVGRTVLDPVFDKGKLSMNIDVTAILSIIENDSNLKLDKTKEMELLNNYVEREIKDRIELTLEKAQKDFHSDIFGFGNEVFKKYPKEWNTTYKNKWDDAFTMLEVSIRPTAHVRRIGLSTK